MTENPDATVSGAAPVSSASVLLIWSKSRMPTSGSGAATLLSGITVGGGSGTNTLVAAMMSNQIENWSSAPPRSLGTTEHSGDSTW